MKIRKSKRFAVLLLATVMLVSIIPASAAVSDLIPKTTENSGSYYNQTAHPENAGPDKTDWIETYVITDLSGPWDECMPITELSVCGYMKNGHKYNKYGACIDTVDGLPTEEEKKAFILINQYRLNLGLEPLIWDQGVQAITETRAIEGFKCHTTGDTSFGHTRPNGDIKQEVINEWSKIGVLQNGNYDIYFYENGYPGQPEPYENEYGWHEGTAKDIVKGWIKSPGHEVALRTGFEGRPGKYGAVAASAVGSPGSYYWYYNAVQIH